MCDLFNRLAAASVVTVALAASPSPVSAQETGALPMPAVEVSGGYVFMRDVSDSFVDDIDFPAGWYAAAAVNLNHWFGIVGEGTGSYKGNSSATYGGYTFTDNAKVHTLMGGPRFSAKTGRFIPYGQVLVGGANLRNQSIATDPGGLTHRQVNSETRFAVQPGGGLSFLVTEHLGVRVAADFRSIIDFVGGEENDYTNEFRFLTGFTFHWGAR